MGISPPIFVEFTTLILWQHIDIWQNCFIALFVFIPDWFWWFNRCVVHGRWLIIAEHFYLMFTTFRCLHPLLHYRLWGVNFDGWLRLMFIPVWVHLINTWVLFRDDYIIISEVNRLAASLKTWVLVDRYNHVRLFGAAYASLSRLSSKWASFLCYRVHNFDWTWICGNQVGLIHTLQHIQTIYFHFVIEWFRLSTCRIELHRADLFWLQTFPLHYLFGYFRVRHCIRILARNGLIVAKLPRSRVIERVSMHIYLAIAWVLEF